jgi:hypothetical protein
MQSILRDHASHAAVGGSSYRLLYSVPLPFLTRHHSTAPPPERYEVECSWHAPARWQKQHRRA